LTDAMLVTLGEREIKTLEDFADLAGDELTDSEEGYLREHGISLSAANDLIMAARIAAGWFTAEELASSQEVESVEDAKAASEPSAV
jgi:N utilization substance protein A